MPRFESVVIHTNARSGERTRPAKTTLDSASTGIGRHTTSAQLPYRSMTWFARASPSSPTNLRAAPAALTPKTYPIAQPIVIPIQITAAPRQNPSRTPAPVETMLEGTGRKTSSASSAAMIDAESQPDACPSASHVPSASNCFSKMRNGMMMSANITPIRTAHRTVDLLPRRQHVFFVLLDDVHPRSARGQVGSRAVIVPNGTPRQRFEFLLKRQPGRVIRG